MNGKIYQILNSVNNEIYVGSTCQLLSKRFYEHKKKIDVQHFDFYKRMRDIGKDKFYIELIELYPCSHKEELRAREGHYIRERGTLNMQIAGRGKKQYCEDTKEHIKEYKSQYYEANKSNNLERLKQYREDNKEMINERITCDICGCEVVRNNMSRNQKTNKCKLIAESKNKPIY